MDAGIGPAGGLVGRTVVAVVADTLCGSSLRTLVDSFIEDDSVAELSIVESTFERLAFDYPLTDDEAGPVAGYRLVRPGRQVDMYVRIR